MSIVQTDNIAAHYRAPIYVKMAKELGCDFSFGDICRWGADPIVFNMLFVGNVKARRKA